MVPSYLGPYAYYGPILQYFCDKSNKHKRPTARPNHPGPPKVLQSSKLESPMCEDAERACLLSHLRVVDECLTVIYDVQQSRCSFSCGSQESSHAFYIPLEPDVRMFRVPGLHDPSSASAGTRAADDDARKAQKTRATAHSLHTVHVRS